MDDLIDVRVARTWPVANEVMALELVAMDGSELPGFEAGAHIEVGILGVDSGLVRPYSLCNASSEKRRYVIAVKRERSGKGGSVWLHDKVRAGDTVAASQPVNNFPLTRSAVYSVLLAGGIGITPMLSMAQQLYQRAAPFELHYSARNNQDAAFAQVLVQSAYRHCLRLHWSDSDGGHIDFNKTFAALPRLSHVYLCGPARYMNAALSAAQSMRWPQGNLHVESFS
jgi:vanillate monooxygenase ferredoxin subunit